MLNKNDLKNNVYKDYIFCFLGSFNLTAGIWMIYLASKGLNLLQIGIMESIYHITSFSMEIPTGIVADLYGRKTSRVLGRIIYTISVLLLLCDDIVWIGLSFALTAIGNNLESGAGQALVYDSLKEINEEDEFMKITGRREVSFQISCALALVVGGYIGTISYKYVYIVAAVISTVTVLQALTFVEPTIGKIDRNDNVLRLFINQLKTSLRVIKEDKRIVFLIISIEVFATFVTTEFFYIQNYFKQMGKNELEIGIILSIGGLIAAFLATKAYKVEKKVGFKGILTIVPMAAIFSFWGVVNTSMTVVSFIAILSLDAVMVVIICDYINRLIPSQQRATILSFQSMAFSFFMIILFPIVGKLGDMFGLIQAFKLVAVLASLILLIVIYIVRTNESISVKSE